MRKIYFFVQLATVFCAFFPKISQGQACDSLAATFITYESRCTATGAIKIFATGGSGSYKYKTLGPVNSNFTSSDSITGLAPGVYSVVVNDLVTNCTFTQSNVVVAGSYQDPRFILTHQNVSCDNGSNGTITVGGQLYGRSPFEYSIVAPSPMGVGTTNSTGVFTNLIGGDYRIQMTDSCGGIQTRSITVDNYTWWIDSYVFNKISCDSATGYIRVIDSKGNVSTLGAIPGFMYGVVRSPGDTIWSSNPNFRLYVAGIAAVDVIAKDGCGTIKKGNSQLRFYPSVGANVNIYNKTCRSFSVSLVSLANFFGADYCIYDSNDVQITCNASGNFDNIPYGRYCIKAHDICLDTTIIRCFSVTPPPASVGNTVSIFNKNCTTFSAAVNGQNGLTNPSYCLFDSADNEISCNTTGIFNNLALGSYCIKTSDTCRDTTITRCFNVTKPHPLIPATITPSYIDCNNITITVGGDSLSAPQYCLYDTAGVLIGCNSTGIFDSLTVGNHCVTIYDPCYDTTITRCFNVGAAIITNDLTVSFSSRTCTTFTVKSNSNNLTNAQYCLYTQADSLIRCNATGTFTGVPYGSYCVKAKNVCPDTLLTRCFTVATPIPSVNNTVTVNNKTCNSFTANITSQQNLTNPQYCIYDTNNVQLSCNTTGIFNNLSYGTYCIRIVNTCYDTTITRCFSSYPVPVTVTATSNKSCTYGYATVGISVSGGVVPINIKIISPDSLFFNRSYNSHSINLDSIPGLLLGQTYTIIATDVCGNADTISTSVTASIAQHYPTVYTQCPSAAWLNGSGKIQLNTTTNMGIFTVRIIKKDGVSLSPQLVPNTVVGGVFTFNDLGAGTYIVSYKLNDICNRYLYDTVRIDPYSYPNLNRSSAYQCDVNGFSVGAVVSNGVGPFSYEIIGSVPTSPSIMTSPQLNPVFSIDNGTNYNLIRLRALDACGNATLADVSVLPLADYKIKVDSNCFHSSSTLSLSVDTIYNSTYAWYKKDNYSSTDSTSLGSGYTVFIPYLSAGDTGIYYCNVAVNSGCVKRTYLYNLNGLCYMILPVKITAFTGQLLNEQVRLNWRSENELDLKNYVVERSDKSGLFTEIGRVISKSTTSNPLQYDFVDAKPLAGRGFYRLRLVYKNSPVSYSNSVVINNNPAKQSISCYPNPASGILSVKFNTTETHQYKITMLNMLNQAVYQRDFTTANSNIMQIPRTQSMGKGIYVLRVIDMNSNEEFSQKVIFQ